MSACEIYIIRVGSTEHRPTGVEDLISFQLRAQLVQIALLAELKFQLTFIAFRLTDVSLGNLRLAFKVRDSSQRKVINHKYVEVRGILLKA